jgi:hypothetical protein
MHTVINLNYDMNMTIKINLQQAKQQPSEQNLDNAVNRNKIHLIHIKQRHKLSFGIQPNPEHIETVAQSQINVAKAIKEHPNCPVVCEGLYEDVGEDTSCRKIKTAAQLIFHHAGLPQDFKMLTPLQKKFLYENGGPVTLFFLREIPSIYKAIHKKVSIEIDKQISGDCTETSKWQKLREKEAMECTKEAAVKYYGDLNPSTVLVVFGAGHD